MDRFERLLLQQRPGQSREVAAALEKARAEREEKQPSDEARIAADLMPWARDRHATEIFLPDVLEPAIESTKRILFGNVTDAALTAFWLGYMKSLEDLKELFVNWQSGQAPLSAPGGEENGG